MADGGRDTDSSDYLAMGQYLQDNSILNVGNSIPQVGGDGLDTTFEYSRGHPVGHPVDSMARVTAQVAQTVQSEFREFCAIHSLSQTTIATLGKNGVDSMLALKSLVKGDLEAMGIQLGQKRIIELAIGMDRNPVTPPSPQGLNSQASSPQSASNPHTPPVMTDRQKVKQNVKQQERKYTTADFFTLHIQKLPYQSQTDP